MKCNSLKKFLVRRMYREETGKILNHLTLQINDTEAVKELEKHKMKQQNSIYYVAQLTMAAHILLSSYSFFI